MLVVKGVFWNNRKENDDDDDDDDDDAGDTYILSHYFELRVITLHIVYVCIYVHVAVHDR